MIGISEELLVFSADLIISPACVFDRIEKLADFPRVQDHTIDIQSGFCQLVGLVDNHEVTVEDDARFLLCVGVLPMHQKQVVIRDLKVKVVTHSRFFNKLRISASAWVVAVLAGALHTDVGFDVGIQIDIVQIKPIAVQVILSQTVDGLAVLIRIMFDGGKVVIVALGAEIMFLALAEDSSQWLLDDSEIHKHMRQRRDLFLDNHLLQFDTGCSDRHRVTPVLIKLVVNLGDQRSHQVCHRFSRADLCFA